MIASTLAAVTGIFLTLAAFQVLPAGVNAISQLGTLGQALGFTFLSIGIVILGGSLFVKFFCCKTDKQTPKQVEEGNKKQEPKKQSEKLKEEPKKSEKKPEAQKPDKKEEKPLQQTERLEDLFDDTPELFKNIADYPDKVSDFDDVKESVLDAHSLVKGNFSNKSEFLAVKIRCTSSKSDILRVTQGKDLESVYRSPNFIDARLDKPYVICLVRNPNREQWVIADHRKFHGYVPIVAPSFIRGLNPNDTRFEALNSIFFDSTKLEDAEKTGFALFKKLVAGKETTDLNGIRWKLCP